MLKKVIALNKSDFYLLWGIVGGVFVLLQLLVGVIAAVSGDAKLLLSGIVLPCTAGGMLIFTTAAQIMATFEQALQFGSTRKRALGLSLGLSAAEAVGAMALAAVLALAERLVGVGLWRTVTGTQVAAFTLDWYWWIVIALAALVLGLIAGAVLQRLGRKGFWALWIIWMACCFGTQLLPWKYYTISDWLFPLIGILVVLALVWSVWSLLHAVIRN